MPLIQCPDCNKSISDNASSCANCGYQLSSEEITELKGYQSKGKLISYALGIIFIVVLFKICSSDNSSKDPNAWKTNDESTMAYIMTEGFVKQNLKSPSTAKFPNLEIKEHTTRNGQVYKINSYVDSQNSFGAMLRTHFTAEIEQTEEEKWKLINLKFIE